MSKATSPKESFSSLVKISCTSLKYLLTKESFLRKYPTTFPNTTTQKKFPSSPLCYLLFEDRFLEFISVKHILISLKIKSWIAYKFRFINIYPILTHCSFNTKDIPFSILDFMYTLFILYSFCNLLIKGYWRLTNVYLARIQSHSLKRSECGSF